MLLHFFYSFGIISMASRYLFAVVCEAELLSNWLRIKKRCKGVGWLA